MNLRDSESEDRTAGDDVHPEIPRAPGDDGLDLTQVSPSVSAPKDSSKRPPAQKNMAPILGVVVIYSETHELGPTELDPRLGRVYPLREGELLFVGRRPGPAEILFRNGESGPPTHCHFFPHGGLYSYISRRHLTVEMDPLGGTILTDYSRHGFYLNKAEKLYRLKNPSDPPESHRVTGDETVILMDELGEPTKQDLADRRSHYCLHVLRSA